MDDFFGNPKIIKLGCGIMMDISLIVENNHGTKGKTKRFVHILDMALFFDKLQEIYPTEMNLITTKEKKNWGLSDLCEIILGQPLNKEERLCDWEKRPLTDSQLEYAALDAFCLVQMYDRLKQIAMEKKMNFDHLATLSMHLTTSQWKPKRRLQGMRSEKGLDINKPLPIQHFKVVIDSALEVQGKQLRQMGADVQILDSSDSPETAVKISKSEERILICSLTLFRQVEHIHPEAFCFKPVNKYGDHTSISSIFHKFNVQLNSKSILSRCMVCNSPECIKLTIDDINFLQEYNKNEDPLH
ncbi:exonuclease mut-7 homolog [Caerostris darwini]|uniref:Exonuclease mut-7 homolog n=1 Tax=Caerostris darwini TaxID=1538125 RepID=A0AAV4V9L6_9ARAC|nr:exonuclease mut-7 homolog [Caerostris darwini]